MAPATIAGAAPHARTGRGAGWDRDSIIIAIREWVATYGEPPRAADWNPSSAKWAGQLWRVERYRDGRADGSPWPALNSAKRPFGGSLNEAIRAAGFEPARPGPRRRVDVDPEQAHRAVISPEGRAMVAAALAQARDAERRVALLEARLDRAGERALRAAAERDAARRAGSRAVAGKPKVVRERVVDDAALARAQRRAVAAEAKAETTVRDVRAQVRRGADGCGRGAHGGQADGGQARAGRGDDRDAARRAPRAQGGRRPAGRRARGGRAAARAGAFGGRAGARGRRPCGRRRPRRASCTPRGSRRRAIAGRPPRPSCGPPAPSASCARRWRCCAARRAG